jgi:hypothetical protein
MYERRFTNVRILPERPFGGCIVCFWSVSWKYANDLLKLQSAFALLETTPFGNLFGCVNCFC